MEDLYRITDDTVLKILRQKYLDILNLTYIIVNERIGKAIIIDPSWEIKTIISFLEEKNCVPEAVFLTHSHFDHVNLAERITEIYNCPVYMSQKEIDYYNFECPNLVPLDNQYTECLNSRLYFFNTPGHTIGSVCYKFEDCLFTGDTLFIETCGICNLNGGSYYDMFDSINFLAANIADNVKIFPGHEYRSLAGEVFENVKKGYLFCIREKELFQKYRKMMDEQTKISQLLVDFFGVR